MADTTRDISAWEEGGIDSSLGINVKPTTSAGSIRIRTKSFVNGICRIVQLQTVGVANGITVYMYDFEGNFIGVAAKNVNLYTEFDYTNYKYRIDLARNASEDIATAFARYAILDADNEAEYYDLNPASFMYKSPDDGLYHGNVVGNLGLSDFVFQIQSLDQEILDGIDEVGDDLIHQVQSLANKYTTLLSIMDRVNSEIFKHFGSVFILGTSRLGDESARLI